MNITLTREQIASITAPIVEAHSKAAASIKRNADARVDRANARTVEWKQRYSATRKLLLETQKKLRLLRQTP